MPEGFLRLLALLFPSKVYAYPEGASKVGVIQLWQLGLAFVNQAHQRLALLNSKNALRGVSQPCTFNIVTLYSMHEKRWSMFIDTVLEKRLV
jgi:hypothetical protein